MTAEESTHLIDVLNETSNQYSVSSADLAQGLGVVASTSSAMGNSLEETVAMLLAITEQTRSASRSARGMNTIFSRLSSILDEGSSNGKAIQAIFDDLDISMYDSQGQMRDTFDLLTDLSGKWEGLNTNTQRYIAQTIAGMKVLIQGKLTGMALELWIPNYSRNVMVA